MKGVTVLSGIAEVDSMMMVSATVHCKMQITEIYSVDIYICKHSENIDSILQSQYNFEIKLNGNNGW